MNENDEECGHRSDRWQEKYHRTGGKSKMKSGILFVFSLFNENKEIKEKKRDRKEIRTYTHTVIGQQTVEERKRT